MCGIVGVKGHPEGLNLLFLALLGLEHRGQAAKGIAALTRLDPLTIKVLKDHGSAAEALRPEVFVKEGLLNQLVIGHTRWPTQGDNSKRNIQPHFSQTYAGKIALASNGDIVNMDEQRNFLRSRNIKIYSENDAEIIAASIIYQMFIRKQKKDTVEAIFQVMEHIKGSFSAVMMTEFDEKLYAFCDPRGIRPLIMAQINERGNPYFVFTSEDCVIDNFVNYGQDSCVIEKRWLEPGEIVEVDKNKAKSYLYHERMSRQFCIFEFIYFCRPDSCDWRGQSFYSIRENFGRELAREHPVKADIVVPVPESGIPAAIGYAQESKIPFAFGILTERGFGKKRTFIEMDPRGLSKIKYHVIKDVVRGKRVVVVDDSVVRGNASSHIVAELFKNGAKEVHLRIPSPPYRYSCDLGVETRDPDTLIASRADGDIEKIRLYLASNDWGPPTSLGYLSLDGALKVVGLKRDNMCHHCFSGEHPLRPQK
ncbi:MAG: class II glutamine amidotransferase [Patescibacteria group bacterium]|nr:class II glutamine amidotransferase [Patescibacteria group bacterium]MDD5491010.1 class II glutamine amidotransferase [Patescibacteria group bacterium]